MMVEFLTPSFDVEEGIRDLPALGVNARALHHLNYLISDPIQAVALYRNGILVQIPRPEKFAIHKLIVADRSSDIWDAYTDAMARGPKWRERIERTLERMPGTREALMACEAA